jgi:hypothetical protein
MARCAFPTSLLFSLGLVVLVCFPRSVMAEWSAIAGSKVSYTDDVTNFSAARRLKFSEDLSQPTVLSTQLSDVIWDPSLEVIRSSSSTLGPNELSIKAHGFIYTNNPIFNFNDDVSYRLHAVSAGTDLTLIESLFLHMGCIYRRKDFASELLGDTHLNRHDDTQQGMAEFCYRLISATSLSASFQGLLPAKSETGRRGISHSQICDENGWETITSPSVSTVSTRGEASDDG